jgi:putative oxidoreductase
MKIKCIFSNEENPLLKNLGLLLLRLLVGGFMLTHGIPKLLNFDSLSGVFPDPLGIGSTASLILILTAEVGAAIFIIMGLFTRFSTIPIIIGMAVAAFIIHANDPLAIKELALVYFGLSIVLLLTGGGNFSVDKFICKNDCCK